VSWLLGLLAVLAAASSNNSQESVGRSSQAISRALTYRSRDGSSFFRFRVTSRANDIRVHILEFPNPRVGSCHVLHDSDGPYICWSQEIRTMAEAKAVAAMWSEATLVYQRTGHTF